MGRGANFSPQAMSQLQPGGSRPLWAARAQAPLCSRREERAAPPGGASIWRQGRRSRGSTFSFRRQALSTPTQRKPSLLLLPQTYLHHPTPPACWMALENKAKEAYLTLRKSLEGQVGHAAGSRAIAHLAVQGDAALPHGDHKVLLGWGAHE